MAPVHFVSKVDISLHATIEVAPTTAPIRSGSVRAVSKLLSITANTKSYAERGHILNMWDCFPVPPNAPAPYGNSQQFGIVPSWGYAEIIESKSSDLPIGTTLFGLWPISALPVEMRFESGKKTGLFIEISKHRQKLMTIYNQFVVSTGEESDDIKGWHSAVMVPWSAGWLLTQVCFPPDDVKPINPSGEGQWSIDDANLCSTVVVTLASSSKAARGFVWGLFDRPQRNLPLALFEVTTSSRSPGTFQNSGFGVQILNYDELVSDSIVTLIGKFSPKRVLVVDSGGKATAIQQFHDIIMNSDAAPEIFDYLIVGADPRWLMTEGSRTRKHFLKMSPLMDASIAAGRDSLVEEQRIHAFSKWLAAKAHDGLELEWGSGFAGEDGIGGAWELVVTHKAPGDKALVFRI